MDAKNLAVLERLKESMNAPADPRPKLIDPKMLLGLLTEINLSLHGEPEQVRRPKRNKKKPNKSVKASSSLREQPKTQAQIPQSAKVVKRQDSKKSSAERKIIHERAIAKATATANAFKSSQQVRPCTDCGMPTKADLEFFLNPVMCQRCKDRSRDVDLGIHPRKHDDFSEITVFKGGSPGLGKRK